MQDNSLATFDQHSLVPTHALITIQRILRYGGLILSNTQCVILYNAQGTFLRTILANSIKIVLAGILISHSKEFQMYAGKLLVDYLLSGASDAGEEAAGNSTRFILEENRRVIMQLSRRLYKHEMQYKTLIAEMQQWRIQRIQAFVTALDAAVITLKSMDLVEKSSVKLHDFLLQLVLTIPTQDALQSGEIVADLLLSNFKQRSSKQLEQDVLSIVANLITFNDDEQNNLQTERGAIIEQIDAFRLFRSDFLHAIQAIQQSLNVLADYHPNLQKRAAQRALLDFDYALGNEF